jgi:hypothetical protein
MRTINRSVLIVRPRGPYLTWAAGLDLDEDTAAETLRSRVAIYLVAEDPAGESETPPLEGYFTRIFECELEAWLTDRAEWPKQRDLVTFEAWFDVVGESIVFDLEDEAILTEEL